VTVQHSPGPVRLPTAMRRLRAALRDRMPDAWVVRRNYFHRFGFYPDLCRPRLLSEKINWLKLHGVTPLHVRCADKIAVRPWVADRIGAEYLVRAILMTRDAAELRPEIIPDRQFAVKANNDTGSAILCHDRDHFDWEDCRRSIHHAMNRRFWRVQRELQYRDIPPGVIVEEMLHPDDPAFGLTDYKLHCFHGEPAFVELQLRPDGVLYSALYTLDWRRFPHRLMAEESNSVEYPFDYPRPERLDAMIALARRLSEPFPLCRVDLYETGSRLWFGELTFTPSAGLERFESFHPAPGEDPTALDAHYGGLLDMDRTRAQLAALRNTEA